MVQSVAAVASNKDVSVQPPNSSDFTPKERDLTVACSVNPPAEWIIGDRWNRG